MGHLENLQRIQMFRCIYKLKAKINNMYKSHLLSV